MDDLEALCDEIHAAHRSRVFLMKQRIRLFAALGAMLRTHFDWHPDLPKKESDSIKAKAAALMACGKAEFEGKTHPLAADPDYLDFKAHILTTHAGAEAFTSEEARVVKKLDALARKLPVWTSFAEPIKGFGAVSLATIVGEAGNLSRYSTEAKLWKRLGIAVIDGKCQGKPGAGATDADWIRHGYNKERRARVFVIGDVLIKVNGADGRYRGIYDRRKLLERERANARGLSVAPSAKIPAKRKAEFISEGHIHRRAQRFMETRLIRDLYRAWRRAA